jgi:hypothetical protein
VADDVLVFREEIGDFGTLPYTGTDRADPTLGHRSVVLIAEQVLPHISAAIGTPNAAE